MSVMNEDLYQSLPNIFEVDDYYECREKHNTYCKLEIQLMPKNMNFTSDIWLAIEKTRRDPSFFDHSVLHRGICLKSFNEDSDCVLENYKANFTDSLLEPASIGHVKCFGTTPILDIFDYMLILIILLLITIIAVATKKCEELTFDNGEIPKRTSIKKNWMKEILVCFSVRNNWLIINKLNKKFDFIEGMRSLTMLLIITHHSLMAYFSIYTENPSFLENLMEKLWFRGFIGLVWFIVQSYFVMSAMLLSMQIMKIYSDNKRFTVTDAVIIAVNRFFRLAPALILIMCLHASHIPQILGDGVMKDIIEKESNTCRSSWYLTMFFINNHFGIRNMCVVASWYLAVDTQLYMISILLCFVCLKYRINVSGFVTIIGIIAISFNIFWNYSHGYPAVVSTSPKSLVMCRHLNNEIFLSLYMSTYSNIASYMIGLLLGMECFRTRNLNFPIMKNKFLVFFWYLFSFGIPATSLLLTLNEYSPLTNAILGSIVKPMYALGCALMIFGMMKNENLILKQLLEWKPIAFLGNFTYSTYLYHFAPVLGKFAHFSAPIQVDGYVMIGCLIWDIVSSYAVGIFMFFFLEYPGVQIQKLFIPSVKKN